MDARPAHCPFITFNILTHDIMKDEFYGVIAVGDSETDYQLSGDFKLPKPRHSYYDNRIEYHQPEISGVSCTIHGAIGCASDLLGYTFTKEERKEMWGEALRRGADPKVGWSLKAAVDLVREYTPKYTGVEVMSFVMALNSDEFWYALDMGYTIYCGFRGNKTYNDDKNDGTLDETAFGVSTYGHAVRMIKDSASDMYDIIVDNYANSTTKPNRYKFKKEHLQELLRNNVFFTTGYVFVIKSDFDGMNVYKDLQPWSVKSVEKAVKKGWDKWGAPQTEVTKDKFWYIIEDLGGLEAVLNKLGGLTKTLGSVSEERLAVALDRLGLLD